MTPPTLYSSLWIQFAKHKRVKHVYVTVTLNVSHLITADDDATHTVQLAFDTVCKTQTRHADVTVTLKASHKYFLTMPSHNVMQTSTRLLKCNTHKINSC